MSVKKILIIEDEEEIRILLNSYLSELGYQVEFAEDGIEGIEKIKLMNPHLVLLDIKLPGIDGVEVLKNIKKEYPEINVIMLSGHATEDIAKQTLSIGAFDYIKKPVDLGKISEVICCVDLMHMST